MYPQTLHVDSLNISYANEKKSIYLNHLSGLEIIKCLFKHSFIIKINKTVSFTRLWESIYCLVFVVDLDGGGVERP